MLYFSRWKTILIWLTVLIGIVYAAPNVLPRNVTELRPPAGSTPILDERRHPLLGPAGLWVEEPSLI